MLEVSSLSGISKSLLVKFSLRGLSTPDGPRYPTHPLICYNFYYIHHITHSLVTIKINTIWCSNATIKHIAITILSIISRVHKKIRYLAITSDIRPPKIQISDITPPKKSNIRYQGTPVPPHPISRVIRPNFHQHEPPPIISMLCYHTTSASTVVSLILLKTVCCWSLKSVVIMELYKYEIG